MGDNFILVNNRGRRRKGRTGGYYKTDSVFIVDYVNVDIDVVLKKVEEARDTLNKSSFISILISAIEEKFSQLDHLLCYGLGSLASSFNSRHQFAALLALKNHFKCPVSAYDPIFTPIELEVLKRFQITVIEENEEGKRPIPSSGKTLVYFPHCSYQLVNNFLWANWNQNIQNCVILSNSFTSCIARIKESAGKTPGCIKDIIAVTEEKKIENTFEDDTVFNDLAVHTFPTDRLIDPAFWSPRPEPNYQGETIDFCAKGVSITVRPV